MVVPLAKPLAPVLVAVLVVEMEKATVALRAAMVVAMERTEERRGQMLVPVAAKVVVGWAARAAAATEMAKMVEAATAVVATAKAVKADEVATAEVAMAVVAMA